MNITKADKLKLEVITAQQFIAALGELSQADIPIKTSYWIGKAIAKVDSHVTDYNTARTKALKKYSETDKNGELVLDDKKNVKFKSRDDEYNFGEELKQLRDVEVDVLKIDFNALILPDEAVDKKNPQVLKPWVFASLSELIYD